MSVPRSRRLLHCEEGVQRNELLHVFNAVAHFRPLGLSRFIVRAHVGNEGIGLISFDICRVNDFFEVAE